MARGGGRLFEGGDYFKYFGQRGGDYSREAINRGTAIIRGNTVRLSRKFVKLDSPKCNSLHFLD